MRTPLLLIQRQGRFSVMKVVVPLEVGLPLPPKYYRFNSKLTIAFPASKETLKRLGFNFFNSFI